MIPDPPYIRDAETNGMPETEAVNCPVCGEECETIFADMYGNVFGCDRCILTQDAWEWAEENREGKDDE